MIKRHKFNAKPKIVNGIKFQSTKEADFYSKLLMLKKFGEIKEIELQPKFSIDINEKHCFNYIADFRVVYENGTIEIIDVKGYKKGAAYNLFRLKKKCVEAKFNIKIIEV